MFLLSRRVLKLIVSKIKIKEDKLGGEYCYTREDVIYDRTGHDFKHQLRIKIPLKKKIKARDYTIQKHQFGILYSINKRRFICSGKN